ncbi:MAG TPA: hypothetical protein PKA55_06590 [Rhodoblastus sp.]|nr:hypothetical protein [Rhodoblastus sp.]
MSEAAKMCARRLRPAGAAVIALALVCGPTLAQDMKIGEDPLSVMMKWKPAAREKEMPDFVKKSRPPEGQLGFTPLTGQEPDRPKRKTPAEVAAEMKKFDAAAAAARARSARAFGPASPAARPPAKRAAAE